MQVRIKVIAILTVPDEADLTRIPDEIKTRGLDPDSGVYIEKVIVEETVV